MRWLTQRRCTLQRGCVCELQITPLRGGGTLLSPRLCVAAAKLCQDAVLSREGCSPQPLRHAGQEERRHGCQAPTLFRRPVAIPNAFQSPHRLRNAPRAWDAGPCCRFRCLAYLGREEAQWEPVHERAAMQQRMPRRLRCSVGSAAPEGDGLAATPGNGAVQCNKCEQLLPYASFCAKTLGRAFYTCTKCKNRGATARRRTDPATRNNGQS